MPPTAPPSAPVATVPPEDWITPFEACAILHCSNTTLRNYRTQGILKRTKQVNGRGRYFFSRSECESLWAFASADQKPN